MRLWTADWVGLWTLDRVGLWTGGLWTQGWTGGLWTLSER